jgi:hypothetical protein
VLRYTSLAGTSLSKNPRNQDPTAPTVPPSPPATPTPTAIPIHHLRHTNADITDDSDLVFCALHSDFVTWCEARNARREGRDLKVDVRGGVEGGVGRFVGGYGEMFMDEGDRWEVSEDDDGRKLLSNGWGSTHDGSGVEILAAKFVDVSSLLSFREKCVLFC